MKHDFSKELRCFGFAATSSLTREGDWASSCALQAAQLVGTRQCQRWPNTQKGPTKYTPVN